MEEEEDWELQENSSCRLKNAVNSLVGVARHRHTLLSEVCVPSCKHHVREERQCRCCCVSVCVCAPVGGRYCIPTAEGRRAATRFILSRQNKARIQSELLTSALPRRSRVRMFSDVTE